jgi:hypothetical protein
MPHQRFAWVSAQGSNMMISMHLVNLFDWIKKMTRPIFRSCGRKPNSNNAIFTGRKYSELDGLEANDADDYVTKPFSLQC